MLSRVSKVAPSDSTVLITVETGTRQGTRCRGAIHKRSQPTGLAFCQCKLCRHSPPSFTIVSELFGHEKEPSRRRPPGGAGASSNSPIAGTLFSMKSASFPRKPGCVCCCGTSGTRVRSCRSTAARSISLDVRVIAAYHRDLLAAVASGTFRSYLF